MVDPHNQTGFFFYNNRAQMAFISKSWRASSLYQQLLQTRRIVIPTLLWIYSSVGCHHQSEEGAFVGGREDGRELRKQGARLLCFHCDYFVSVVEQLESTHASQVSFLFFSYGVVESILFLFLTDEGFRPLGQ